MSGEAGFTTIYRWSGAPKGDRARLFKHSMRDLDKRAGVEITHSNTMIDETRTLDNETFISDGQGGFERATSIKQFTDLHDEKIAAAPKNVRRYKDGRKVEVELRSDAAVMLEYVLQLDPDFTGEWATASPEMRAENRRLLGTMVDEVIERDGYDNVLGWTLNIDETNAHVHMYTVPVDEDGRINMKLKFNGKSKGGAKLAYTEKHDLMRKRLLDNGYEATFARIEGHTKHVALAKYKAQQDEKKSITADRIEVGRQRQAVHGLERRVSSERGRNYKRGQSLDQREEELEQREAATEEKEVELNEALDKVKFGKRQNAERSADLDARAAALDAQEVAAATIIADATFRATQVERDAQIAAQLLLDDAEQERDKLRETHAAGLVSLTAFDTAVARLQELTPIMEEWLDTPTKSGGTLRHSYERYASKFKQNVTTKRASFVSQLEDIGADSAVQESSGDYGE